MWIAQLPAERLFNSTSLRPVGIDGKQNSNSWIQEEDLAARTQALLGDNSEQVVHLLINYAQSSRKFYDSIAQTAAAFDADYPSI